MLVDKETFISVAKKIGKVPFEQTIAWKNYKGVSDENLLFFVDNPVDPYIACWGRVFKKPGIGKIVDIISEIAKDTIVQKLITQFFKSVIEDADCNMITYSNTCVYDCKYEIGLRRAGFNRPMGSKMCPLTMFIDIQGKRSPDRNWKRNIKKAIEDNLQFTVVEHPTHKDVEIVSDMFTELRKMKSLNYEVEVEHLAKIFEDDRFYLFFVKQNDKPICARVVYIEGKFATDVLAANSFESRKNSSTHYIMENIFNFLKEKGVETFDFARIPPSNDERDSVYIFKNCAGGYPVQYNGEWIWSNNRYFPLLFGIYNFFTRGVLY